MPRSVRLTKASSFNVGEEQDAVSAADLSSDGEWQDWEFCLRIKL